jgi:hypothetical protein
MSSVKLATLNLLKGVPFVAKWLDRLYNRELLKQMDFISSRFGMTKVRYTDNIHLLYDALKGSSLTLEEDFEWLYDQRIKIHTKTSGDAHRLLDAIITDRRSVTPSAYFRDQEVYKPIAVKAWYSNAYSVNNFFELGVVLIGIYCSIYPTSSQIVDNQTGSVFDHDYLKHNPALQLLLTGTDFKLVVSDLIEVTKLISRSRLRNRYGKEEASFKGQ